MEKDSQTKQFNGEIEDSEMINQHKILNYMKKTELIKRTIIVTITAIITIVLFNFLMRMCIMQITIETDSDDEMLKSEFRE